MIYFFPGPDASAVLLYKKIDDLGTVDWGIRSRNYCCFNYLCETRI